MRTRRIHFWCPDLRSGTGGIQRFSWYLLRALRELPGIEVSRIVTKDRAGSAGAGALEFGGWPGILRTGAFALGAIVAAVKDRPDLILSTHLHYGPAARLVHRHFGIPYWLVAHGIDAWQIGHAGRERGLREAERVLCVSEFTRGKLLDQGLVSPEQAAVFPNTFDHEQFFPGPKPPSLLVRHRLANDTPTILTVGRLALTERYKGFDELLEALPQVLATVPETRLIIVGDGDARARLAEKARALGVGERVIFVGRVGDEQLSDYYRLCDVFAMPSRKEGFGIVFLEALSTGKPVLAGNLDASGEALLGGELGVLVDPANVPAIAEGLISLLRKTHPTPRLFEPDYLRQRAIDAFGFATFQRRLGEILEARPAGSHPHHPPDVRDRR